MTIPGTTEMMNDPPGRPPLERHGVPDIPTGLPPGFPPGALPPDLPTDRSQMTTAQVDSVMAREGGGQVPTIETGEQLDISLPAGYIDPSGRLWETALVRELNGYDEERLARIDVLANPAKFVSEMLLACVETIGDEKPTRDVILKLLLGDRDALMLGIRRATYGDRVEFKITCAECDNESEAWVDLKDDVRWVSMEDRLVREFEVELKHGRMAIVRLIDGATQEAFSGNIGKKTPAEISTLVLARSVLEIGGVKTMGQEDPVKRLGIADRATLTDFIMAHQPGPQLNEEIPLPCATCGTEYRVLLGLPNLFRL